MKASNDVFQLLGRERRRYVLYYLQEARRPVSVDELAETVAEWESSPSSAGGHDEYDEFDVVLSVSRAIEQPVSDEILRLRDPV